MRPDMSKVIVERARLGGRDGRGRVRNGDLDALPLRESMRRTHLETRSLNENLSPLRRYLRRQAGRPWNKVFADISANLRPDSTVQQHVRDHLFDFVAVHVVQVEGRLLASSPRRFRTEPRPLEEAGFDLYVDPIGRQMFGIAEHREARTGILRINRHRRSWRSAWRRTGRERAEDAEARRREVTPLLQLHKLRGCWFEVRLAIHDGRLPVARSSPLDGVASLDGPALLDGAAPLDVVLDAGLSDLDRETLYGRGDVHAVAKRQMGKKEMRRAGVENE